MKYFQIIFLIATLTFGGAVLAEAVNINNATAEQLTILKGIGQSKAQAIIQYRKQHGKFKTADDLARVKGIGVKTVSKNREDIKL